MASISTPDTQSTVAFEMEEQESQLEKSRSESNDMRNSRDPEKLQQGTVGSYLVDWDSDNDPLDPRTFSKARKWLYLIVVSIGALLVTCSSSTYTPAYDQIMEEFDCSLEVATLGLSLYVLGVAFGPLLFGPLSEFYGRRPIYLASTVLFLIWMIPCAVAQNIQTLLIARFFDGLMGSAFLSVAGGTVVDMFTSEQLVVPMTIFTGVSFGGPATGPFLGGLINSFTSWRWTFYVPLDWSGALLVCICFVNETYHPILLSKKAAAIRQATGDDRFHTTSELALREKTLKSALLTSLRTPFKMLFLDPMVAVLSLYTSLLQGILYLFFDAFPLVFGNVYGFNLWQVGLTFLGLATGNVIACLCNPLWHKQWTKAISKRKTTHGENYQPEPELRLPPAMLGAPVISATLFWFSWTTVPSVHWIVPIIATVPFSVGFFFAFQGVWTFKMAAYPKYAASVMAVNTTTRCIFSAAFPLFTVQMYDYLGYQWASSLIAFLTLAMVPFPFLFYRYGKNLRGRSRFASL